MDFQINDLSIHGQFTTPKEFASSVDTLMEIRQIIRGAGRELYCHRGLRNAQVTSALKMSQVIKFLEKEKQRAWMQWLTKEGPYWQDSRQHTSDDWFELNDGTVCTDQAIGEVGFCTLSKIAKQLVSCDPSDWLQNPINVIYRRGDGTNVKVDVTNHWAANSVHSTLQGLPPTFNSWKSLDKHVRLVFDKLTFSKDAFSALNAYPYVPGASGRILERLQVLNTLSESFDANGNRTPEGHQLFSEHFTGAKAWFSDSSDSEKADFRSDLTFPHPGRPSKYIFCTWHGKVKTPQLRLHFSWPIVANSPVYVVYVGPKITTR